MEAAARLFERAVAADSTYALAHAGVALAQVLLPLFAERPVAEAAAASRRAAERALALDSTLAEAHAALSQRAVLLTWDRDEAVAEGRRAIELRPSYATGWQWYAEALLVHGREEEALDAIDRALELDPLAAAPINIRAWILYTLGRPEEGAALAREGQRRFPDSPLFGDGLLSLGMCSHDTALIREGAEALTQPLPPEQLQRVVAAATAPPSPERHRELLEMARLRPRGSGLLLGLLMASLGDADAAADQVEAAVAARDPALLYMLAMPCLQRLSDHPRFQAVLDRLP